jgi:hypothetical protein
VILALALGLSLGQALSGAPVGEAARQQTVPTPEKSELTAFGLSLACELPTLFFGPSCGHAYAGEDEHFYFTGALRLADLAAVVVLEKWGYGIPPLFDVLQLHVSKSLSAEPLAYPVDLALVLVWVGTGIYDLIDSVYAAKRANQRRRWSAPAAAAPGPGLALIQF